MIYGFKQSAKTPKNLSLIQLVQKHLKIFSQALTFADTYNHEFTSNDYQKNF